MLKATVELSRQEYKDWLGNMRVDVHSIEYRLSPRPFKVLSFDDLPSSYELDNWETEDDSWIKKDGVIYNLKEFCSQGMPIIPAPCGGVQVASNGYFAIAVYECEVYGVSMIETKPMHGS